MVWPCTPSRSAAAIRSCSSTSSPATTAPGSRRCAASRGATAASPTAPGAIPRQEVPSDPAAYSQQHAVDDAIAVLDAHDLPSAHVIGISMGGFAGLHLAMQHPRRVRSLVVAGTGYGARPGEVERFRGECDAIADLIEASGIAAFAQQYMSGPSRVQLQNKDPRAWQEYTEWLSEHSAEGSAATMRGVQRGRPSLYALEAELAALASPDAHPGRRRGRRLPGDERVAEKGDPNGRPGRPSPSRATR